jgi:hypothetical protein
MMDDLSWSTLKERCTKTRLINFYKISNNKMEIPYTDILLKNKYIHKNLTKSFYIFTIYILQFVVFFFVFFVCIR